MPTHAVTDKETKAVRYVEAVRVEAAINHVVAERFTAERIKIESIVPVDPVKPELRIGDRVAFNSDVANWTVVSSPLEPLMNGLGDRDGNVFGIGVPVDPDRLREDRDERIAVGAE